VATEKKIKILKLSDHKSLLDLIPVLYNVTNCNMEKTS